jgi:hypothetical protein
MAGPCSVPASTSAAAELALDEGAEQLEQRCAPR